MPNGGKRDRINRAAIKRVREIERHNRREAKLDRRAERELQRRTVDDRLPDDLRGLAATLNRGPAL